MRDRVGADVLLDFETAASRTRGWMGTRSIEVYANSNPSLRDAVSTFVHEAKHRLDLQRGTANIRQWTQLDEVRAMRREFLFEWGRRPSKVERLQIWDKVQSVPEYRVLPIR